MNAIGQTRTAPTIKPQVSMNRKLLSKYEIKLGLVQIVVLLGAVTGSVVCAFLLGLFAGQHSGYESALASSAANVSKLPVLQEPADVDVSRQLTSEVLAKLDQSAAQARGTVEEVPPLGIIEQVTADGGNVLLGAEETSDSLPLGADLPTSRSVAALGDIEQSGDRESLTADGVFAGDEAPRRGAGILGDAVSPAPARPAVKTLGELEAEKLAVDSKPQASGKAKLNSAALTPEKERTPLMREGKAASEPVARSKVAALTPPARATEPAADDQIQSVLPRGWFAQVAAPRKLKDADILAKKLKGSGFATVIETANVRGQDYFRVLVGPEETRKQAQVLVDQLKRETYIPGEPFLRLVR